MSKKIVVVCGATGNQGRSVINALIKDGGYTIRGLTRNTDGTAAQELASKGVEMMSAELSAKESLVNAFKDAYAVFGVTAPFQPVNEEVQGRNLVDACKANGVALFVWSSLPSATELSNGKYTDLRGFDDKALVDKYINAVDQPAVIFKTGAFAENLVNFGQLGHDASDPSKWHIYFPLVRSTIVQPVTYIEADLGPAVVAVVDKWDDPKVRAQLSKAPITLCSFNITGGDMAETIQRVTGKNVDFVTLPEGPPGAGSLYEWGDSGCFKYEDTIPPPIMIDLGVKFHTFEDYVKNKLVAFMDQA